MPDRVPYANYHREPDDLAARERKRFYNSKAWKDTAKRYRALHPLCERCQALGDVTAGTLVHHKIERLQLPPSLWFNPANLETLCKPCHTKHHNQQERQWG